MRWLCLRLTREAEDSLGPRVEGDADDDEDDQDQDDHADHGARSQGLCKEKRDQGHNPWTLHAPEVSSTLGSSRYGL